MRFFRLLPVLLLVSAAPALADIPARAVSVNGSCQRQATPDRGSISMVAEAREMDLQEATKKATRIYERARDAVKKLGLEDLDLRTAEYSVGEIREWEANKSVFKGFRARMGLRVATSSIQKLGEVIVIASREGLVDVGALTTFMSDAKQKQEHFACLQAAAENARAKAEKLAVSLGAKLGPVLAIVEAGAPSPGPRPQLMMAEVSMAKASRDMAPPSIEAGQDSINVNVAVTFAIQ